MRLPLGILIFLVLAAPKLVVAACCPYEDDSALVLWQGAWGPEFQTQDFPLNLHVAERLPACGLIYEVPFVHTVTLFYDQGDDVARDGSNQRYNFWWVPSTIVLGLQNLLAKREEGPEETRATVRVLHGLPSYLLHAPNFTLKYCLTSALRLNAGTRSDLVPYRFEWGERGVLFTPRIGLELSGGSMLETSIMGRASVEAGYGTWWNWDGPDRATGWRVLALATFVFGR